VRRVLVFCAITLGTVALAPVIVLAGEPLRRYYMRQLRRPPSPALPIEGWQRRRLARLIIANPVMIALTAPERWALDQVSVLATAGSGRRGFGRFRGRGGSGPPLAGVREPRRPRPSAPAGAIALAEPRLQHRAVPILKALPPALSEPARRIRSSARRMTGRMIAVLRWRGSRHR
jgi:hypothetical protein